MSGTNYSDGQENVRYSRFVSDRVDELLGELDEGQLRQLFDGLKSTTVSGWLNWLARSWESICEYDALSCSRRARRLRAAANATPKEALTTLSLHHACVFVELWRLRLQADYFHLPPHGPPVEAPHQHRELLLAALASCLRARPDDLWPFEFPDGESSTPFRDG